MTDHRRFSCQLGDLPPTHAQETAGDEDLAATPDKQRAQQAREGYDCTSRRCSQPGNDPFEMR